MVRRGQEIAMETRHFMEARGITQGSRSKEEENDYRYFPEPDLRPLKVSEWARDIELPELPDARRERFMKTYGISVNHAKTLTGDLRVAEFYEKIASCEPVLTATLVADTLLGELYYRDMKIADVPHDNFEELVVLLKENEITDRVAVDILRMMLDGIKEGKEAEMPSDMVQRLGLSRGDDSEFDEIISGIIEANPQAVEDFRSGNNNAVNFLVGQVMKETRGRADPKAIAPKIIRQIEKTE